MQRKFALWISIVIALSVCACATLLGPREVNLPLSRLQESLDRKFPFTQRYFQIFEVNLSHPQLALLPETNRIGVTLDAMLTVPFAKQAWQGKLSLSGGLLIDQARQAIVLTDTRIDRLNLQGIDNAYAGQLARIGDQLTQQFLNNLPLYTFKPGDFSYAGARFTPTRITTGSNSLVVTFEPAK